MQLASRSSNAYKLQPMVVPKKKNKTESQKKKRLARKKEKAVRYKLIALVVVVFISQLYLCSRWVALYGLHNEIEQRTAELNRLSRENQQKSIAIDSMVDSSRVEEYAKSELGMRKIESSQIVYVRPVNGDSMQKVANKDSRSSKRGIFGVLSSTLGDAMEYLR